MKGALIVVDVQNDFVSGSLPVSGAEEIIAPINRLTQEFANVMYTRDYHPEDHCSFKQWPAHCVMGTPGSALHSGLVFHSRQIEILKGTDKNVDSYSAFFDNLRAHATTLHDLLKTRGVKEVFICGLATDFCVAATVQDALYLGYKVFVPSFCTKAIANKEDTLRNFMSKGVIVL